MDWLDWHPGNLPFLRQTICSIPFMCPNAWLRTCGNHPCSHIYHSDTKQNIKHQMSLELSQIFLIFEQSKLLKASGNWNDLWMFRVAKLLTIVHVKTKLSTLSCITMLILTKTIFFLKKVFFLLLFSLLYLDIVLRGRAGGTNLLRFFFPETVLSKSVWRNGIYSILCWEQFFPDLGWTLHPVTRLTK